MSDGYPLTLSAGKFDAALTDDGLVTIWELFNELIRIGDAAHLFDRFEICMRIRKANVVQNSSVKKKVVLQNNAQMRPIIPKTHSLKVFAVDFYNSFDRLNKIQDKTEDR